MSYYPSVSARPVFTPIFASCSRYVRCGSMSIAKPACFRTSSHPSSRRLHLLWIFMKSSVDRRAGGHAAPHLWRSKWAPHWWRGKCGGRRRLRRPSKHPYIPLSLGPPGAPSPARGANAVVSSYLRSKTPTRPPPRCAPPAAQIEKKILGLHRLWSDFLVLWRSRIH
jgi:hypothetical protein